MSSLFGYWKNILFTLVNIKVVSKYCILKTPSVTNDQTNWSINLLCSGYNSKMKIFNQNSSCNPSKDRYGNVINLSCIAHRLIFKHGHFAITLKQWRKSSSLLDYQLTPNCEIKYCAWSIRRCRWTINFWQLTCQYDMPMQILVGSTNLSSKTRYGNFQRNTNLHVMSSWFGFRFQVVK